MQPERITTTVSFDESIRREVLEHAVDAAVQVIREDGRIKPMEAAVAVVQAYFAAAAEYRRLVDATGGPASLAP
jgi:collagenase-like PrtC family protease